MGDRRRGWSAALLAALLLAGCINDTGTDDPIIITDPDDFSYAQNSTDSGRPHIHNYWGGQERLSVLDQERGASSNLFTRDPGGYHMTEFRPPAGNIIPLGTAQVEVTVDWREETEGTSIAYRLGDDPVELWVKTAADDESVPYAQLTPGATVVIESTNPQNDIPHQRLSGWEFWIAIPPAVAAPTDTEAGSYAIHIQMQVEAVRGLEIPAYPSHPDLWKEEDVLPFAVANRNYRHVRLQTPVEGYDPGTNRNFYEIVPDDGAIVPYDADHVLIRVAIEQDTLDSLRFIYHGADTWEWQEATRVDDPEWTDAYRIPVTGDGDSPYALQSLWRIWFEVDTDRPFYAAEGSFYLEAKVHGEAAE